KVFSTLEPTPLGSASVAQVHKAVIRETGDVVAVKVQRPQVKKLMNDDISLLRRANDLLEITPLGHGGFEISAFVDELDRTVKDEIDFRKEAQNLKDFRRNCEDVEHITSPRVFEDLTSETILVMDYVEGPHIDDVDAIAHMDVDMHEMGTLITQNYIKQMLDDGLFHADPHAGNIIVVPDGIEWIDLGMVGRLTANDRGLLRQLFFAVASRDPQELKKTLLIWGRPVGDIDQGRLLRELDAMISRYASDDIADLDIASALGDLLALIRGQHIMMPPSFTMLARGIMSFEGTIETIAPDISIVGSIDEYMRHSLIADFDVRQELRDALMALRKLSKKGFNAPSQLFDVLDMLMKGELSVRVEPRELEKPMSKLESTIDRLTLGMITAGLFIGSSMLCMTQMEPRILGIPAIGFLGFLGALILSLYIVFKGRP
ncbi:MAG: AarF/UbiB family protein, partial [Eggerthellaceae bacterium]|nr:AarF/UbiB family protein [Eggerthellaceae bacterium]